MTVCAPVRPDPVHRCRRPRARQAGRAAGRRAAAGGDSIASRIDELSCGFKREPTAMHRLDTDTSGCLLFARTAKARSSFQQAFEARSVEKYYLAIVASEIGGRAGGDRSAAGQGVECGSGLANGRRRRRPRRDHAVAAIGRPRWRDARRVPAADRAHAPDPRACPRGVRSRDRRRPGVRRSRRSDAAPCLAAGCTARTEAGDRCRLPRCPTISASGAMRPEDVDIPEARSAKAFSPRPAPAVRTSTRWRRRSSCASTCSSSACTPMPTNGSSRLAEAASPAAANC